MVIRHNLAGLNAKRNERINESKLRKNLEKLSSGYKINRAGDDAAGLAISEQLRYHINGTDQALDNIGDGINMIQVAEGAMQEVQGMLNRMYECGMAACNGTYTDEEREVIQVEVEQLVDEIQRIGEDSRFYYVGLLSGDKTVDTQFQIGSTEDEVMEIDLPNITLDKLGVKDIDMEEQAKAQEAMENIEKALNYVSEERGRMGAYQNRLEYAERALGIASENLTAAESRIRDTDTADEITSYTKNNIILQASQSMMTQANAISENVLSLIQ